MEPEEEPLPREPMEAAPTKKKWGGLQIPIHPEFKAKMHASLERAFELKHLKDQQEAERAARNI